MSGRHISESLPAGMRERGNLPRRIRTTCAEHDGEVFAWDDARGVFVAESGRDLVALPWIVRQLWGATFWPASRDSLYIGNGGAISEVPRHREAAHATA